MDALSSAEKLIPAFNDKLRVTYDDDDLKGIMETARREVLNSSQVPQITEKKEVDNQGKMETKEVFASKYFLL